MFEREAVIATTHVDSQGDKLTLEALQHLAETINSVYVPVTVDHDPRQAPLGRMESASVRSRPDGEYEVVATLRIFESPEDSKHHSAARELRIESLFEGTLVSYDYSYRNEEDQEDIKAIAEALGTEPQYEAKKAADPLSVLGLLVTAALGAFFAGMMGKMGADTWDAIRPRLANLLLRSRGTGDKLFKLHFNCERANHTVEVDLIATNPSIEDVEFLLMHGVRVLDDVVPAYLSSDPDLRRLVFCVEDESVELKFGVRSNCSAVYPNTSTEKLREGLGAEKKTD